MRTVEFFSSTCSTYSYSTNGNVLLRFKSCLAKPRWSPPPIHPYGSWALVLPLFHLFSPLGLSWPLCSDHNFAVKPLIRRQKPEYIMVTITHTYTLNMPTYKNSVDEKGLEDQKKTWLVGTMSRHPCMALSFHMCVNLCVYVSVVNWWCGISKVTCMFTCSGVFSFFFFY